MSPFFGAFNPRSSMGKDIPVEEADDVTLAKEKVVSLCAVQTHPNNRRLIQGLMYAVTCFCSIAFKALCFLSLYTMVSGS